MGRIAVLGEPGKVADFALAGALVIAAENPEAVAGAWAELPGDVTVVILTPMAARTLGRVRSPYTVVMGEWRP